MIRCLFPRCQRRSAGSSKVLDGKLDTHDLGRGEGIRGWVAFEFPKTPGRGSIKNVVDAGLGKFLQVGLKK
jgi:hypothetical protein